VQPRVVALVVLAALAIAGHAEARGPKARRSKVVFQADWEKQPSARYGALDEDACLTELGRRGVEFTKVTKAPGVLAPVRLPSGVGGVVYRTENATQIRATNPYDVFDCRLVLALSDFSKILAAHEIDEVLVFSGWRPPGKSWPDGKVGTRHPGGLATDAFRFGKKLGPGQTEKTWLDVRKSFHGRVGAKLCGAVVDGAAARELRSIVCEAVEARIFTSILTPNYDRAHFNHFHLEVTPGVPWVLYR
jgi:hypothetical protein